MKSTSLLCKVQYIEIEQKATSFKWNKNLNVDSTGCEIVHSEILIASLECTKTTSKFVSEMNKLQASQFKKLNLKEDRFHHSIHVNYFVPCLKRLITFCKHKQTILKLHTLAENSVSLNLKRICIFNSPNKEAR